jgi:hypothetical protein
MLLHNLTIHRPRPAPPTPATSEDLHMITTVTIHQPHYGPQGQPYIVRARFAEGQTVAHYWTEREAMEARGAAFDADAHAVHVAGLPFRSACVGPEVVSPLMNVDD